jgi:hypothetical protein
MLKGKKAQARRPMTWLGSNQDMGSIRQCLKVRDAQVEVKKMSDFRHQLEKVGVGQEVLKT